MRRRVLFLVLGAIVLLGACSSASGESTSTTTEPARPTGATVTISATGFAPQWAMVAVGQHVDFVNRTATAQQIVFDNARDADGAALQSPTIEPGATWRWTADSFASFAYHSPRLPGVDGRIQVDPPAEND